MKIDQIHPTKEQIEALKAYPADTPLTMVNIIKYKSLTESGESGQQVYNRYIKNVTPFLEKAGAKLIWKGNVALTVIGSIEGQPDTILLVEYPSKMQFFGMVMDPDYQKVAKDRTMALEYGGLIACQAD